MPGTLSRRRAAARGAGPGPRRTPAAAAARRAAQRPRRGAARAAGRRPARDPARAPGTTALLVTHDQEEAFAVADAMAVMRAGRVVQSGSVEDVWRHPVDAWTARFLGYATRRGRRRGRRVPAPASRRTGGARPAPLGAAGRPATDRSRATVLDARSTPEQLRLRVAVPGVGELEAVAGTRRAGRGRGSDGPAQPRPLPSRRRRSGRSPDRSIRLVRGHDWPSHRH